MPTEILLMIMKNVIPSEGHITIGYNYFGTNHTGIQCGSLNILRVSKIFSAIALDVLYSYRHYVLATETTTHQRVVEPDFISFMLGLSVRKPVTILYVYH